MTRSLVILPLTGTILKTLCRKIAFGFKGKAMHPVKAMAVASQAYSYYKPEIKGETLSKAIPVK